MNSLSYRSNSSYPFVSVSCAPTLGVLPLSFQMFRVDWGYEKSRQVIVQKFLSLGQQQKSSCQRNFQGTECKAFI